MTSPAPPGSPHILIADDTPANVLLLARMLEARGYQTRSAFSGIQALEDARAETPDLILLDITMPGMNGYEVCQQLKADPALQDVPVIFISALSETIDKVKAFNAGGVDYVTKPFHFEEVQARVRTHLHLHRLEQLSDDLTHMVVHDLRNPLSILFNFLDILEGDTSSHLSPGTHALVTIARRSAGELLDMITSILDVSKMGAGEMALRREPVDLDALLRSVVDAHQPLPGNRTVTLAAPEASRTISADIVLMRRVLQNLLSNALKYTPAGGDVHMLVVPEGDGVRITVTDTGPGIAPAHHQRIFEKFGQVESGTHRLGTGLGLAFCKLAIEAHGGRIGVESELGRGSCFWLTLPGQHAPQVPPLELELATQR